MSQKFVSQILKGSISTSVGQFATIGFHFLSIMVMTRVLPKEEFGIYILILVVVDALKIVSSLGLDLTLVQFISPKNADNKSVFWAIAFIRSVYTGLMALLFFSLAGLILPSLDVRLLEYTPYLAVIGFLASFRELLFFLQQGLRQFKNYAIIQVSSAIIKFVAILIFLGTVGLSIGQLIWIELTTYLLSILIQLFFVPRGYFRKPRWTRDTMKALLKFGMPLYLNNILAFTQGRLNVVLIAALLNPVSVAYYGVAKKLPEALARMFKSFVVVYFPNLSRFFSEGKKEAAEKLLNQSLVTISTALSFVVLGAFLFRDTLVVLIFSEKYLPASLAVALLILNFSLHSVSSLMGYSLVSAGQPAVPAKINTVTNFANLGLSFFLLPRFDFLGAVYSLLLLKAASQFAYGYYLHHIGVAVRHRHYLPPLLLATVMGTMENWLGWNAYPLKILILIIYALYCWFFVHEFRRLCHHLRGFMAPYLPFAKSSGDASAPLEPPAALPMNKSKGAI